MQKFLRTLMLMAVMLLPFASHAQSTVSSFPYTCGFETTDDATAWVFTNSANANHWIIGTAADAVNGGTQALYISNDNSSYAYSNSSNAGFSYATLTFEITSAVEVGVSFDWKCNGESTWDFLRAWIAPGVFTPTVGQNPTGATDRYQTGNPEGWYQIGNTLLNLSTGWNTASLNQSLAAGTYTVVLMWYNDGSGGSQPPAAIDNFTITATSCLSPTNLVASNITATSATLTWNGTATGYTLYEHANLDSAAFMYATTTADLNTLEPNTVYTFGVTSNCGNEESAMTIVTFRTGCAAMSLPYTTSFEAIDLVATTPNADALPFCWNRYASGTGSYTYFPYSYSSSTYKHTGSRLLYFYDGTTASYPDTMVAILPELDVVTYPMNANRLTFWGRVSTGTNVKNVQVGTMTDPTDMSTFALVETVAVSGTTHTLYSVPLTNASATAPYLAIMLVKSSSGYLCIDDLTLEEMPSCLEISNLTAGNITSSSVELTWSDAANASATYTVYNMADTSVVATGVAGTTYTVTGLTANTQYTFGVAANCPAGDASVMTVSARTSCGVYTLPFSETFDASLSSDPCWAGANILYADGVTPTMGANSNWTYTGSVSNGIEAGHYRVNIYGTSCYKWLITPAIDLTTATNPMLTFDAAFTVYSSTSTGPATGFENNDSQKFMVLVSTNNGQTWTLASDIPLTSIASGSYLTQYVSLAAYAGETVRVAFYAQSTTSGGDNNLHIDNIAIDEVVGEICYPVTGLAASNITTDGATLTWTGDAASYNVYVIAADTTLVQNVATTTLTLTGLTAMTQYTYGVRAVCTSSESDMVSVTFATACPSISLPFTETFEATSATTGCWTTDGPGNWTIGTGDYTAATGAYEGSLNAKITHGTTGNVTKLISPVLSGVTNGLQLTFAHIQRSWSGDIDNLAVYYRTSSDASWQQVVSYTDAVATWTVESVTIPGTIYQVAFEYTDNYGYGVGVDSVVFDAAPSCLAPVALTASDITTDGATLTWTGDAASYNVYAVGDGATTLVQNVTAATITLTGLTAMTSYTYGVTSVCGGAESEMATVTFATACGAVAIPYTVNFTDATFACWSMVDVDANTGVDGNQFRFSYNTNPPQYLISPELSGTANGVQVSFQYRVQSPSYPESFVLGYSTTTNDTSSFTWGIEQTNLTNSTDYVPYSEVMPAGVKYVAIKYTANDMYYLYINNLVFAEPPACAPVSDIVVDSVTATSVAISWTDANNTGATYTVYNMADTSVVATGITALTYTVTGLTASTNYVFGVAANCSATEVSDITTVTARTACVNSSCNITIATTNGYGFLGGGIDVMQNGSLVANVADGASYVEITETVSVCSGAPVTLVWNEGAMDSYVSFTVQDGGNTVVYTCTDASTLTDGAVFTTIADPCPACLPAADLTVDTATTTSITISWTGDAASYNVYVLEATGTATLLQNVTTTTITLTGLTANTQYTYGVATVCGTEESSMVTVTFRTPCTAVDIPYIETFETTSATADCWTTDGPGTWTIATGDYSAATGAYEGSLNAKITHGTTGDVTKFISPVLSGVTNGMQLQFAHIQRSWSGDIDNLAVYYRTSSDAVWQQLAAYTNEVAAWTVETINIPGTVYQVAFEYTDNYGYGVGIDSIAFNLPPACMPVVNLTASNITATGATLSWTGSAASYNVYAIVDSVATLVQNVTVDSIDLTGLTAMTAYTYGVRAVCGTDESEMTTVTFATACGGETCNIEINGADSYGDGWNGNAIQVMQAGNVIATFTIASGNSASAQIPVCSGYPVSFAWVSGSYPGETSFEIKDGAGMVVYSESGSNLTGGEVFYTMNDACPSCIPAMVAIDTITETSVTISWTGTAASYDVYNGTTLVTNTTNNTYTFTGLTPATTYTFGVQAICSATDTAALATITVTTACADITTLPYMEGFENGLGCWSTVNGSADGMPWYAMNQAEYAHTGASLAISFSYYNYSSMHADAWLISPKFVLPTVNAGDTLNFSWWYRVDGGYPLDLYDVMLSTTTDDTTAFTTTLLAVIPDSTNGEYTQMVVDLTAYAGQSIYLAFHHHDSYDQDFLMIDDIFMGVGAAPVPEPDTLTVTFAVNDATMGTTVPAPGTYQYFSGDTLSFRAMPNTGYIFNGWVIAYGDGSVDSLSVDYISASALADVFMNFSPMTITALFGTVDPNSDSMQVNVAVNDPTMGTTIPAPGTHYFHVGEVASVVAVPNDGYHLTGWTVNVVSEGVTYVDTTYNYAIDDVFDLFGGWVVSESNAVFTWTVTANFAAGEPPVMHDSVTVNVSVNNETMGVVTPAPGTHYYVLGDTAIISIMPNPGYRVVAVQMNATHPIMGTLYDETITDSLGLAALVGMNDTLIVDDEDMYGLVLNINVIFAAEGAEPTNYTVEVAYDQTKGTVTGAGDYVEGSNVRLVAMPATHYEFYAWLDNNTGDTVSRESVYAIANIDRDYFLTAIFVASTGIDDVDMDNVTIYSTDNVIVVRGAEGKQVVLFDVNGRMLSREARAAENVEFRVNNSGVYLVKVADAAAKRVVVIR